MNSITSKTQRIVNAKLILFIILALSPFTFIKAQHGLDNLFGKGHIIGHNDTLQCLIKLQGSYKNRVPFKLTNNSAVEYAKLDKIKYVITEFNSYAKIKYKRKTMLAVVVCWGKINYYEYLRHSSPSGNSSTGWSHSRDIVTNYIEKDGVLLKTKKNRITDEIKNMFIDNPKVYKKIKKLKIKKKKLIKLIQEYNKS